MDTDLARSIAAVNAEVRQAQIGLPLSLGSAHPALGAVDGALADVSDALGGAVAAAAAGDRQAAFDALTTQVTALRATAAYVCELDSYHGDSATIALTITLAGIADLAHLLAGGELSPPS